jgi:hypothetical protein
LILAYPRQWRKFKESIFLHPKLFDYEKVRDIVVGFPGRFFGTGTGAGQRDCRTCGRYDQ